VENAMTPRMLRLGLSFIVGVGCWIGKVEAQEPTPMPMPVHDGVLAPRGPIAMRLTHPLGGTQRGDLDERTRTAFNRHGYCCGQHHNWYGCGGWRAQNVFVFGSCRTFFSEPCLPNGSGERLFSPGAPANVHR